MPHGRRLVEIQNGCSEAICGLFITVKITYLTLDHHDNFIMRYHMGEV